MGQIYVPSYGVCVKSANRVRPSLPPGQPKDDERNTLHYLHLNDVWSGMMMFIRATKKFSLQARN